MVQEVIGFYFFTFHFLKKTRNNEISCKGLSVQMVGTYFTLGVSIIC